MTEHASVPLGKSLFYRSTYYGKQPQEVAAPPSESRPAVPEQCSSTSEVSKVQVAFYDKMNESIEQALSNAVELLELARRTKMAADQAAESTLVRAREEHAQIAQQTNLLTEERDHLKHQVELLQEQLTLEENQLQDLSAKKAVVQAEMSNLEHRRDELIETLQSRLAIMNQIQESLQEGLAVKLGK